MQLTEDSEGGWARTFAVASTPSIYLINARGEFVWKHEGEPEAAALSAALDKNPVRNRAPRFQPLRLAVSPGNALVNALFDDDRGRLALHRFRGRQLILNFWQSWSAPCLAELARLQRIHGDGSDKPFVIAIHGGADANAPAEIARRLRLSFRLVQDDHQRIARRYGVRCWPTTITIGANGEVQHIQLGVEHEHGTSVQQSEPSQSSA